LWRLKGPQGKMNGTKSSTGKSETGRESSFLGKKGKRVKKKKGRYLTEKQKG